MCCGTKRPCGLTHTPSSTPCCLENRASPCRPKLQSQCDKVPEVVNLVRPAIPSSCCVPSTKLWESEGVGCVLNGCFICMFVCVCVCVGVHLFRLTGVPSLRGPVIKPLCTQCQSLAYIYLLYKIHGGIDTDTHKHTHKLPQTAYPYQM